MSTKALEAVSRAVCRSLLAFPIPAKLDRTAFVAQFLPKYAGEYRPSVFAGIRLNSRGRCIETRQCHRAAAITKRNRFIDEAFAEYVRLHDSQTEFDAKCEAARIAREGNSTATA